MKKILIAITLIAITAGASLAETSVSPKNWGKYVVSGDRFVINGNITRLTLAGLKLNENRVKVVELNSNGGHTDAGYAMAQIIRENNMDTFVGNDRRCYSACTIMFQAGKNRVAAASAEFMYHTVTVSTIDLAISPADRTDTAPDFSEAELKESQRLIDYLRTYGVDEALLKKITAGHDEYVIASEARLFNIVTDVDNTITPLAGTLDFDWATTPTNEQIALISTQYNLTKLLGSLFSED